MPYKEHEIQRQYKVGEVAKEASCSAAWIRELCDKFKIKVHRNGRNDRMFTEAQKDSLVKLRWMYADFEKCVEYCWKNNVKI